MSAPFTVAARPYLGAGWWPIPIRGKAMPVKGVTGYEGSVTAEKVEGWLVPNVTTRALNGRGVGMDNIGIRHQLTLAIDVDQGYGSKGGVAELAAFATRAGLPPLPGTLSSTARGDDSPSRQYIYRIERDEPLKTKPCDSVELCNWHHRFTACWPSIHPNGNVYRWYAPGDPGVPPGWGAPLDGVPALDGAAWLPAEWYRAFIGAVANADRTATTVEVPDLVATFSTDGPDGLVRYLIEKWSDESQHVGHDEAKGALIHAFMLGREGRPGVAQLLTVIFDRFTAYLTVARPGAAEREAATLVEACAAIAQQKPLAETTYYLGATPTPAEFMAGAVPLPVPTAAEDPNVATDEEMALFLSTYTRYGRPDRLGRRAAWMTGDAPSALHRHARYLVADVFAGHYPARKALDVLQTAYRHHGGQNPAAPRHILSAALGATLNAKVSA
jgi:hypothetical protein